MTEGHCGGPTFNYRVALVGPGGELDSFTVVAGEGDTETVTAAVRAWLVNENVLLDAGDRIEIDVIGEKGAAAW